MKLFGFFIVFLGCASAVAEPVVIFKGEKVVSAEGYYSPKKPTQITKVPIEVIRQELAATKQQALQTIKSLPPYFRFPYKTEGLSIGKVLPKSINKPEILVPFFFVGGDEKSKRWLQKNKDRFKADGAVGFVVEAKSMEEYKLIQETAGELGVVRFEWNGLAKKLGITHYPVYVTKTSVEQ